MSDIISPERFRDNPALKGREDKFITCDVKVAAVLASWQESLFAHEWLTPEGTIKSPQEMTEKIREKRETTEHIIYSTAMLDRPVLGVGIMDNIEIGAGKDVFLTLAGCGASFVPVHIPKSHEQEFRMFIR